MKDAHQISPFSLRIAGEVKDQAKREAEANHRSLNAEFCLLIKEGLQGREKQRKQPAA